MAEQREDRRIVGAFDREKITRIAKRFPMIVIYDHPSDYSDRYVARLWDCDIPTHLVATADTLEEIRATIPPNMTRLPRMRGDAPCIVEAWI